VYFRVLRSLERPRIRKSDELVPHGAANSGRVKRP
jgi:hypothetical protein